jgi:glucokinase
MISIAIDLGATNLRIASFDKNFKMLDHIKELTTKDGMNALNEQLYALIERISNKQEIDYIGVSICGPVDSLTQSVLVMPNLNIQYYPIGDILFSRYNCKVKICNDANASTYYESQSGLGVGYRQVCYLTISSGIGAGLVTDGKIYDGYLGYGLEIGKTYLDASYKKNFENTCSGIVLRKTAKKLGFSHVSEFFKNKDNYPKIYDKWLTQLTHGIVNLICIVAPQILIIGGGVLNSSDYFFDDLQALINKNLPAHLKDKVKIALSPTYQDAPLYGMMLLKHEREYN